MSAAKEIFVKIDKCVGCHSCELACAVEHSASKNLFAALGETPRPRKRLFVEPGGQYRIPVLCRHCEDAPCAAVCPTGATYVDAKSGLVLQATAKCIGCQLCVQACPFGMMASRAESRIAVKCDRCPDRAAPACVDACPTGALMWADSGDYSRSRRRAVVDALVDSYLAKEA